jgi:hypothetical protein
MEIYYNNYLANYFCIILFFWLLHYNFSYYSIIQTKTVTLIKEQQYTQIKLLNKFSSTQEYYINP